MNHELDCEKEHTLLLEGQGRLEESIGEVRKGLEYHIATTHGGQIEEDINDRLDSMATKIDFMADVVLGEPQLNPIDGTVTRVGGMKELVQAHQNGGIKAALPKWLVPLLVAIITTVGTIGVAVIEQNHFTDAQIQEIVQQVETHQVETHP